MSDEAGKLAAGQEVQPVLVTSRPRRGRREPRDLTDGELTGRVYRQARCAGSPVDPDNWFPVTHDVAKARDQAAQAIAVCACCPVRPDCLELSLRYAFGIGAHGVWGGLVEEERRSLRRRWLAGTSVTEFLTGARSGPVQPGEPRTRTSAMDSATTTPALTPSSVIVRTSGVCSPTSDSSALTVRMSLGP